MSYGRKQSVSELRVMAMSYDEGAMPMSYDEGARGDASKRTR
jgi:hypothetical protein